MIYYSKHFLFVETQENLEILCCKLIWTDAKIDARVQ